MPVREVWTKYGYRTVEVGSPEDVDDTTMDKNTERFVALVIALALLVVPIRVAIKLATVLFKICTG